MHRHICVIGIVMTAVAVMAFGVEIQAESAPFSFPGKVSVVIGKRTATEFLRPGTCMGAKNLMPIHYSLPEAASVRIYSIDGSLVARFGVSKGKGTLMWNISDQAAGMYFMSLHTGSGVVNHKLSLYK